MSGRLLRDAIFSFSFAPAARFKDMILDVHSCGDRQGWVY